MIALVSEDLDDKSVNGLQFFTDDIVLIKKYHKLYSSIASHPDIQCFVMDSKKLVVHPQFEQNTIKTLINNNINVLVGKKQLQETYPENISYNAVRLGKKFIHNLKYTDDTILSEIQKLDFEFINVKQGYTKCSLLVVNDRSIITSDGGIAKSLVEHDFDVLLISPGYIILPGLKYGFIGGACGTIHEKKLIVFNGDINTHPDGRKICRFIKSRGMDYFCINTGSLVDVGSILFI